MLSNLVDLDSFPAPRQCRRRYCCSGFPPGLRCIQTPHLPPDRCHGPRHRLRGGIPACISLFSSFPPPSSRVRARSRAGAHNKRDKDQEESTSKPRGRIVVARGRLRKSQGWQDSSDFPLPPPFSLLCRFLSPPIRVTRGSRQA